jgi:hypothetical protein
VRTTHQDESRIHNGGDAEIVKTDREVLVNASMFDMMLNWNKAMPREAQSNRWSQLRIHCQGEHFGHHLVIERPVMRWSRVGDVKIEHRHHARIDSIDHECVDDLSKSGLGAHLSSGTPLLTTRIFQTIWRRVVTEAISVEVVHVASPAST